MDMDSAVENLIGCGQYQVWHFILFQWVTILQACNIAFMVFGKYLPPIDCDSECIPWADEDERGESVSIDYNGIKCENTTRIVLQFHSVAIEWNLYCSKESILYLMLTTQMLGILIGSILFGQLSDLYGRRKVLLGALVSQILCGTASAYSIGWEMFLMFRAFIGFFGGGTHTTNQVYFAETVNSKHRLWLSNIGGWPLSVGVFVFVSWLTKDWSALSFYSNVMCIPTLFILWHLDESPRWRFQHGQFSQGERTLKKYLKAQKRSKNDASKIEHSFQLLKRTLSAEIDTKGHPTNASALNDGFAYGDNDHKGVIRYSYVHLFSTWTMRKYTFIVALTHFVSSCIAHGIMFLADSLSGDIYLNLFLLCTLRWAVNIATIIADVFLRIGRKHIFIISCIMIAILAGIIVTTGFHVDDSRIITGLALTAGALSSPLWISTLLWPAELFPTPVRNLASSFGAVFDRLGGIVIPQILLLAKVWPKAPYAMFAMLAIIAALAVAIILPETKGRPLPERMPNEKVLGTWEKEELVNDDAQQENTNRS